MDTCVVCLESNADIFSRINTKSSEWKECNIQRIIEKHLWWWCFRNPSNDSLQWICRQCWQELSSFHNFYLKVEQGHKRYELMAPVLKIDIGEEDEKNSEQPTVKEEIKVFDIVSTLTEDLVPLENRRRGKRKKLTRSPGTLHVEELPVVEVKSEYELNIVDQLEKPKEEYDNDKQNADYEISNIIATDSPDDIWEPDNDTDGNIFASDDNVDIALNSSHNKIKNKSKPKSAIVSNGSKKKSSIKRKRRISKKQLNFEQEEIIRKNDEFIAQNKFDLICNLCNGSLANFQDIKSHYRKEHKTTGYATCCNKKFFKRSLLVDHINVHKDPNYFKCQYCHKIMATRRSLETHLDCLHNLSDTRERTYNCGKCDRSFFKKGVYDRHLLLHVTEEDKKFQCTECDKKFATESQRKQHISLIHGKRYSKICHICGKILRDKFSFIRHMDEHSGAPQAKVPCDICGIELSTKYRLNRHKKMMHTEENLQKQKCPYCPKVSPNVNALAHHVNYAHTSERKHGCHMCDKKFKRPKELKEHISTHTGEPLYTCPHCPKTFISSANMHKHRKLSHRKEWEEARLKKLTPQQLKALTSSDSFNSSNIHSVFSLQHSYPENLIVVGSGSIENLKMNV